MSDDRRCGTCIFRWTDLVARALCIHEQLNCWETHTDEAARVLNAIDASGLVIVPRAVTDKIRQALQEFDINEDAAWSYLLDAALDNKGE